MYHFIRLFSLLLISLQLYAESPEKRPRVGLVLSGGGAKAAAHIPLLKALDSLQIEVDYIAGTSMGSFIGALYAIGYSADRIEKIFFQEDWNKIMFDDKIRRTSLAMSEKYTDGRYISTFPLERGRINLPSGLNPGQSLSARIAHYAWPVNHRDNFNSFPTPFLCIATDIETGEAVVLEKGFLPDAILASMAFPSVLSPVEINDRLLVDGGLVRNFPVSDLKERGVDIVIGSDVSAKLYAKNELNSVVRVLEQISSYSGAISTYEQRKQCDILITPDISGFDAGRFDALNTLYQNGYEAVQSVLPQLITLATQQKKYGNPETKFIPLDEYHPIHIKEVRSVGLKKVSQNLLDESLQIEADSYVSPRELEQAIERAYGSQHFKRVAYKFEPDSAGIDLIIRVKEQTHDQFKFGVHYDSDMRAAVLLNTTFRNKLIEGSTLTLDLRLSETPTYSGSYFVFTGWKPGLGVGLNYTYQNIEVPLYDPQTGVLMALMDYGSHLSTIWLTTIFSNLHSLGIALEWSYSGIKPIFTQSSPVNFEDDDFSIKLLNFFLFGGVDSYDRAAFPSKGLKLYSEFKLFTDEFTASIGESHPYFNRAMFTMNHVVELSSQSSWFYGVHAGVVNRLHFTKKRPYVTSSTIEYNQLPSDALLWIGGVSNTGNTIFPFVGANFMEYSSKDVKVVHTGFQLEPWKDKFVVLRANKAFINEQVVYDSKIHARGMTDISLTGYGLTLGMITPIGPMEYTIMGNSNTNDILSHLSIGYYF